MRWFSCSKMTDGVFQLAIDGKEEIKTDDVLNVSTGEYSSVLALVTYVEVYKQVKLVDIVVHPNYKKVDLSKAKGVEKFCEIKIEN